VIDRAATQTAIAILESLETAADGLARKSRKLTLDLLAHTPAPFSRAQFTPGHITCTALVLHPQNGSILLMHHHRLHVWLLPGGHIEPSDTSLAAAAAREAFEETLVRIDPCHEPFLASVDVHGIPPKRDEPFHLHHDLIWCFRAVSAEIETTDEATAVLWANEEDCHRLNVAESIHNSMARTALQFQ
jgi:8-oxo-dGTP pyrophosphatase MutT (NUDIX family)